MERWRGATAVVTGAGSGIGAAAAGALAAAGLRVVALDQAADELVMSNIQQHMTSVASEECVTVRRCDVTDVSQLVEAFRWVDECHGGPRVLVNSAGVLQPGHITAVGNRAVSIEQLSATLDVNTKAVVVCCKLAVESMARRGVDGHVININSLAGHYVPFASEGNVYCASKYAVTAFTQALCQELAEFRSQIKVTSISPGTTDTQLAQTMLEALGGAPAPALRPADVAGAVLYALSTPPHVNVNYCVDAFEELEEPMATTLVPNCSSARRMSIFRVQRGEEDCCPSRFWFWKH